MGAEGSTHGREEGSGEARAGVEGGGRRGQCAREKRPEGSACAFFFLRARARVCTRCFPWSLAPFFLSNMSRASKTAQGDASTDQGDAILSSFVASPMLGPAAHPDA
jgi:hypothetical protein